MASKIKMKNLESACRRFFYSRGFSEVKTPETVKSPFPEPNINAVPSADGYYRTSPELHLKILLSQGMRNIFEIGPCRRQGEKGKLHKEKFTMLEWYQNDADYKTLINFTKDMLVYISKELLSSNVISFKGICLDFSAEWQIYSLSELFAKFANMNMQQALKKNLFEEILTDKIEPNLPRKNPVIIKDYPAEMAALSKLKADNTSLCERWELYLCGVEIANTYTELTDPLEHRQRFNEWCEIRKNNGLEEYRPDPAFLDALEMGLPESAGCALGMDRLLMIMNDADCV